MQYPVSQGHCGALLSSIDPQLEFIVMPQWNPVLIDDPVVTIILLRDCPLVHAMMRGDNLLQHLDSVPKV